MCLSDLRWSKKCLSDLGWLKMCLSDLRWLKRCLSDLKNAPKYAILKWKKNRCNLRLPRVTMRGQLHLSTRVSMVSKKGKLYE